MKIHPKKIKSIHGTDYKRNALQSLLKTEKTQAPIYYTEYPPNENEITDH